MTGICPGAEVRRGDAYRQGHATRLRYANHTSSKSRTGLEFRRAHRDCDRGRVSKAAITKLVAL